MDCGCCLVSTTCVSPNNAQLSNQKKLDEHFIKQESSSERQKRTSYKNSSHVVRVFEVLDSLRKDGILCDITLETEDGTLVHGHKVVLASATPYFQVMFTRFEESKKSHVILHELDSTIVQLLVDFIYTGQIMVTKDNVQVLLQAANLLQLHDVKEACCDFLQTQLNPKNCLSFKELISLYDCEEYLSCFKSYILQYFSEVVEDDEFLNLSCDELVELISCDELNDSSEEKVFECVVKWVNHDLSNRKDVFPKLMEHVRLPLASKEYLHNRVREEPLLKNSLKCRDYLEEALYFHLLKSEKPGIVRTKPRQPDGLQKVILVVGREKNKEVNGIQWFDPSTKRWQPYPELRIPQLLTPFTVLYDRLLFFLQNNCQVFMLDLFSQYPCCKESVPMLKKRRHPGVSVLDNCIYIIGGGDIFFLRSAEVFNLSTQKWQMISDLSIARQACGVGVLNNHLYAVGGSSNVSLKSVERYCPKTDTWAPAADLNECRSNAGVGVLNGVMYAVGGTNGRANLHSVEAYNPSSNSWTYVSNMHKNRNHAGVVALNGLLYVVGTENGSNNYSIEVYDPTSNIWTLLSGKINIFDCFSGAVVINKPPYFNT